MIKVWLTGANGQIGRAINRVYNPLDFELLNTDKDELDVTNIEEVKKFAIMNRPDIIINCSAITDIDLCESDPKLAFAVNALGARNLSIAARSCRAKLVQISTDDVFDGMSNKPYNEFDITNPRTVYGKSKTAGEGYVKEFMHTHFIIRSTWVYGDGYNFVNNFIKECETNDNIKVASDQFGSPTSADELARFILHIMKTNEYGTYHATCKGVCSRYELAKYIAQKLGKNVEISPVHTSEIKYAYVRPAYAVLDNFIMSIIDVYDFPDWKTALDEYLGGLK